MYYPFSENKGADLCLFSPRQKSGFSRCGSYEMNDLKPYMFFLILFLSDSTGILCKLTAYHTDQTQ